MKALKHVLILIQLEKEDESYIIGRESIFEVGIVMFLRETGRYALIVSILEKDRQIKMLSMNILFFKSKLNDTFMQIIYYFNNLLFDGNLYKISIIFYCINEGVKI